jgi:ribosomal protein S18 acetylase RimI-like enzyme
MPVTLRPAQPADVDAIAAVWHDAWRDGHVGHVPDGLLRHRGLDQFRDRAAAHVPTTTVAVVDDAVLGFVTVVDDEVEQVFVSSHARGTAVAASLLTAAEEVIAATFDEAWLAVVAGNARARRFYERQGWVDTGPLAYEADTEDGRFPVPSRRYAKPLRPNDSAAERS